MAMEDEVCPPRPCWTPQGAKSQGGLGQKQSPQMSMLCGLHRQEGGPQTIHCESLVSKAAVLVEARSLKKLLKAKATHLHASKCTPGKRR